MMVSATVLMSEYFSAFDLVDAPKRVVHEAKRFILDSLGCLLAGCDCELAPIIWNTSDIFGEGSAACVAGKGGKANLLAAIYANGRLANALDYDETFPVGAHFGSSAVVAALGFAEAYGLTGREFLNSVLAGYEFGGRVASYIGPVVQIAEGKVIGFPDVWGVAAPVVLATTAASARARRLDAVTFAQAVGIAGSNAPLPAGALWSDSVDLPNCKYCDAGWCAVTGSFATWAAERGSTGYSRILDAPKGIARMCGNQNAEERWLTDGLGTTWMMDDLTYKPWPTCRFTHYVLTALEELLRERKFSVDAIEEIVIETGPLAASERFTNPFPKTFASREFSYPHMVAMRLLEVEPGPKWLEAGMASHPEAARLKAKIRIERHPRSGAFASTFTRNQIRTMPGGIRIRANGTTYYAEAEYALGDPWAENTRFTDENVFSKLARMAGPKTADRLIEAVMGVEYLPNVDQITSLLATYVKATSYD
jgi:2-methylcitrate dehydratase PrpD